MELRQEAKGFGVTVDLSSANGNDSKKDIFPYDSFNTENINDVPSNSEPYMMEDFNSSLKNTKISQKDYKIYLQDAKRFKNRWDNLQYYNGQDTYIMVKPLKIQI
ncbi:MAG: hypothetical protein EZS28_051674, partial [Streblomastix strix]